MASTHAGAHLPALGEHQRDEVGNQLQALLVELIDLALFGKQLHWNVTGPLFRPLHEQLDELVESWRELSDVVAERAVALGYFPDGQSAAVAAGSNLKPSSGARSRTTSSCASSPGASPTSPSAPASGWIASARSTPPPRTW